MVWKHTHIITGPFYSGKFFFTPKKGLSVPISTNKSGILKHSQCFLTKKIQMDNSSTHQT